MISIKTMPSFLCCFMNTIKLKDMMTDSNIPGGNDGTNVSRNDTATYGDDTIGENTGDSALAIDTQKGESAKAENEKPQNNDPRVETVVPDNDN